MSRQVTAEDVELLYKSFATRAVEIFNEEGEAKPQVFFVTLGAAPGEVEQFAALHPQQLHAMLQGGSGKDLLGESIRAVLEPGSPAREGMHAQGAKLPDIVVQISEAWQSAGRNAVSQPDRREVIVVAIHQHGHSAIGCCPILENPRRAEYAEIFKAPDLHTSGRLTMTPDDEDKPTCH